LWKPFAAQIGTGLPGGGPSAGPEPHSCQPSSIPKPLYPRSSREVGTPSTDRSLLTIASICASIVDWSISRPKLFQLRHQSSCVQMFTTAETRSQLNTQLLPRSTHTHLRHPWLGLIARPLSSANAAGGTQGGDAISSSSGSSRVVSCEIGIAPRPAPGRRRARAAAHHRSETPVFLCAPSSKSLSR
jgi:hypothetical protein